MCFAAILRSGADIGGRGAWACHFEMHGSLGPAFCKDSNLLSVNPTKFSPKSHIFSFLTIADFSTPGFEPVAAGRRQAAKCAVGAAILVLTEI